MQNLNQRRKINLIPSELAVPSASIKLAAVINKTSIWLAVLLVISVLGFGGYYYYLVTQNNKLIVKTNTLKSKIESLIGSEQKLVLAKDRIAKIGIVQDAKAVDNEIGRFKNFNELVSNSSDSNITEANLTPKGTEVSFFSKDSNNLSSIIDGLSSLSEYKNVILTSLGLNPGTGYIVSLMLEI